MLKNVGSESTSQQVSHLRKTPKNHLRALIGRSVSLWIIIILNKLGYLTISGIEYNFRLKKKHNNLSKMIQFNVIQQL